MTSYLGKETLNLFLFRLVLSISLLSSKLQQSTISAISDILD